jgi:MFS family permease
VSQRAKVAVVVCVGVFLSSLDLFIVNIAFPDLRRDFPDSSLAELSWVLNVYAIVFAALLVPAGRWADRAGRKRAFLAGLALFMVASAASAAAPSVEFLIGARAFQAAGAALMLPTSLALLLPEFPPHRRRSPSESGRPRGAPRPLRDRRSGVCSSREAGASCSS